MPGGSSGPEIPHLNGDAMPWEDAPRLDFIREHVKTLPVAVRLLLDMRVRALTSYASSAR